MSWRWSAVLLGVQAVVAAYLMTGHVWAYLLVERSMVDTIWFLRVLCPAYTAALASRPGGRCWTAASLCLLLFGQMTFRPFVAYDLGTRAECVGCWLVGKQSIFQCLLDPAMSLCNRGLPLEPPAHPPDRIDVAVMAIVVFSLPVLVLSLRGPHGAIVRGTKSS